MINAVIPHSMNIVRCT